MTASGECGVSPVAVAPNNGSVDRSLYFVFIIPRITGISGSRELSTLRRSGAADLRGRRKSIFGLSGAICRTECRDAEFFLGA